MNDIAAHSVRFGQRQYAWGSQEERDKLEREVKKLMNPCRKLSGPP